MNVLLVLPVVLPILVAVSMLPFSGSRIAQRGIAVLGLTAQVGLAIALLAQAWNGDIHATSLGGWPAPFGIVLVADIFSSLMVLLAAIVGLATVIYSIGTIDPEEERLSYYPIVLFLISGVSGAFLTGDLFNLYVWFEVMLITSFVLLALEGRVSQTSGAITYVILNLVSSALFLSGLGLLYGVAGTVNMADLAVVLPTIDQPALVTTIAMFFLVAFGIKAAMFPLFFWLPFAYPVAPIAVGSLFAGLLTKVGVYALIRVFTLVFTTDSEYIATLILVSSGLTMATGVLGAIVLNDMRRILSFHIVSQIGYMTMGLGLGTPLAIAGSVFYITHHILVKANLFLIAGIIARRGGSYDVTRIGGLYRSAPLLGLLFLIPALSLAGIPPLSGFFAKFMLVRAAFFDDSFAIAVVALAAGVLTLFSMTKIWAEAFWKARPAETAEWVPRPVSRHLYAPVAGLALCSLALGLWPEPFVSLANDAAVQLTEPDSYIETVLGSREP